jgi:hypothetical protein
MGRLKSFERRKAREKSQEGVGVRLPLMCAAEGCAAETDIGWIGEGPFPAAMFFKEGWMARSDPSDGIVRFYCASCWKSAKDEPFEIPPNQPDNDSEVSG